MCGHIYVMGTMVILSGWSRLIHNQSKTFLTFVNLKSHVVPSRVVGAPSLQSTVPKSVRTGCTLYKQPLCLGSRSTSGVNQQHLGLFYWHPAIVQTLRQFSATRSTESPHSSDTNPTIYTGPLTRMVKMVKLFSLSTSCMSAVILASLFMSEEAGALKVIGGSMAALIFLTPVVLHWLTKSYVTEIQYNRAIDTYTAYTVSFLLARVKLGFTPDDVTIPAVRNLMTSVMVKGKPLMIDPKAFANFNHHSHMMGYDKLPDNFSVEEMEKAMAADEDDEPKK